MSTHLFAWNPKLWNWPELPANVRALRRRGHFDVQWACGRHRHIEPGSRAFLVRLGVQPKGLFGSGVTMTAPVEGTHWIESKAHAGIPALYTMLRLDSLFELPVLLLDELAHPPFARFRWAVRSSGTRLPSAIADALEPLWEEHLAAARASPNPTQKPRKRARAAR